MPNPTAPIPAVEASKTHRQRRSNGIAQLSLVEHALCPLDDKRSLVSALVFDTGYFRADRHGHARWIPVRLTANEGLSANDEYYLWGLLAAAFAQPQPGLELWATPHWCLRQLGILDNGRGGQTYAQFRRVLRRLAGVTYFCQRFYDPIRKEERDRAFGFLKYDLPLRDDSNRAWRIVWDPLFFEYCQAKGGRMNFDLATYRRLSPAARRLFLLLAKVFWRRETSPRFDVWHLAVHGVGFSDTLLVRDVKAKLVRAIGELVDERIIALPLHASRPQDLFEKKAKGAYAVSFQRGSYFTDPAGNTQRARANQLADLPLYDPLRAIGFTDRTIGWLQKTYRPNLLQLWSDITLAAMEHKRAGFFSNSPQAFFLDNVKHAASGRRGPPDWWHELTKRRAGQQRHSFTEEFTDQIESDRAAWQKARAQAFRTYLDERVGKTEYDARVLQFREIFAATMPAQEAMEAAIGEAERHFLAGFSFPDFQTWLQEGMAAKQPRPQ